MVSCKPRKPDSLKPRQSLANHGVGSASCTRVTYWQPPAGMMRPPGFRSRCPGLRNIFLSKNNKWIWDDLGWFGMISVFSCLQELPTNSRPARGISRISPVNQPTTERYRGPWKCLEMLDPRLQRQDLQNMFTLPNNKQQKRKKRWKHLKTGSSGLHPTRRPMRSLQVAKYRRFQWPTNQTPWVHRLHRYPASLGSTAQLQLSHRSLEKDCDFLRWSCSPDPPSWDSWDI